MQRVLASSAVGHFGSLHACISAGKVRVARSQVATMRRTRRLARTRVRHRREALHGAARAAHVLTVCTLHGPSEPLHASAPLRTAGTSSVKSL